MEAIAFLVFTGALGAFWLLQWRNEGRYGPAVGGMSNRAILLWSLGLTLPVQYCWLLVGITVELTTNGVRGGDSLFGCPNFHGSGLEPCSFGEMLVNLLVAMLIINFVSFGIAFLLIAAIIGAVLLGWRRWRTGRVREMSP